MNLLADLRARGLVQDSTPGLDEQLQKEVTAIYIGFDPTADSLHVGNLVPVTLLMRIQRAGHIPYALVGGATGMIGDPSGKSAERNLLDLDTLDKNVAGVRAQLEHFLDFSEAAENRAHLVNNYDWFREFSFLHFIRDVGKHITVSYMMAKESVQKRLETGLSFTEFTYQLIQGYDFYYLYNTHDVKVQMGGADQWGNIVTGTELIRRKGGGEAHALTCPLLTKADGSKFGKSEQGNVWLDASRTSPYQFYQYWLGQADADAERLVMVFSFKPVEELQTMIETHREAPHKRALQKALAEELTAMVHGEEELYAAQQASDILFGSAPLEALQTLSEKQLLGAMEGVPQVTGTLEGLSDGMDLLTFLADRGVYSSKGEARKAVQGGGFSVNKEKVKAVDFRLGPEHLLAGKYMLLQKGKREYWLGVFG
jgi:tyrosyl-tRNA synthetase